MLKPANDYSRICIKFIIEKYLMRQYLVSFVRFIAFLAPLTGHAQVSNVLEAGAISRFERKLATDVAKDSLNGSISAVIIRNDKVIWAKAFGYENPDTKKLADTSTIYRMGSITKTVTATLLMLLVENKTVALDDPADKYVPEVARIVGYGKDTRFTLRQLAAHTSGLYRNAGRQSVKVGGENIWQGLLLGDLPTASFASKPGKQWLYSDLGHAILQLALERAAKQPYVTLVKERILSPLHMMHTYFSVKDSTTPHLALGLDNTSGMVDAGLPRRLNIVKGPAAANGSLYTTPLDLAKLIITFMVQPGLLSKASLRKMQITPAGGKDYGLGFFVNPRTDYQFIGHDGFVPGYRSQFVIEMNSKYAVILMRNYNVGITDLNQAAGDLLMNL